MSRKNRLKEWSNRDSELERWSGNANFYSHCVKQQGGSSEN